MKTPEEPPRPRQRELFLQALERADPAERGTFLDAACGGDPKLREAVDQLLAHHREDSFLEEPPGGGAFSLDALPEPSGTEAIGDRIGSYKLLQKIGEGGCGIVYMAEQATPVRRRVALKVIKLGMDTKSVIARFEAERQALAMMDHPHIARVLEAGATDSGRPYFVMELVRGVKITDYCDQHRLATPDRLELFIKVCHAIQHAHQKGIVHRDIKPSNILVTLHDGVAVPKVIDFGIAKATNDQRLTDKTLFTALEQFVGTPAYMSPEQAELSGLDIDTRSDIYSLGVLLYEILAGKTPFDTQELLALGLDGMRRTIREQEPVRPSTRLSTMLDAELTVTARNRQAEGPGLIHLLRGDVDWIVMKCLEKDRARRYETAFGLAGDIRRHLEHEVVLARPPSAAYRFRKLVRRNKLPFAAAAVVAIALILGIAVSSWEMLAARRARNGEQQQRLAAQAAQRSAEAEQRRADTHARVATESRQHSRRLLYASEMYLAQQALKMNNLGQARRLLDRHRPQAGEEDLRGWEWRYLWQLTRPGYLVTLTNGPTAGGSISFSADGAWLAVGWFGGQIDLWEARGRRLVRVLAPREAPYHHGLAVFSPVRHLLAIASKEDAVTLHELGAGQETPLWHAPAGEFWNVTDLDFSRDGTKLAIYAGGMKTTADAVWVVEIASGKVEGRYPAAWSNSALHGAARFSPDGRRLYLAQSDPAANRYSIQCLDLATGGEVWQSKYQRDYGVTTLAVSPDGKRLASGSGFEDPTIRIWDTATGELLDRLPGHAGWVSQLEFTRDGARLISAASDQSIRVWNTATWITAKVLLGHSDEVYSASYSEPAQLIVSAGKDGKILLWNERGKGTADGYQPLPQTTALNGVLLLEQSRILSLSNEGKPEVTDLKGESSPASRLGTNTYANSLGLFGTSILCRWDGTNRIQVLGWNGSEFVPKGEIRMTQAGRPVECAYNAAREFVAWQEGAASNSIFVASLAAPMLPVELKSDRGPFTGLQFSGDGKHLAATGANDHSLRVWNIDAAKIIVSLDERVRGVKFAAQDRVLVAAIEKSGDHEIGFYDLEQPIQAPRRIAGPSYASALAVSPDGQVVALASGQVWLFNPVKGELLDSIHGHLNGANGVAFSRDGKRLISTSGGREAVKVWDVSTRQELLTLAGAGSLLEAARWSDDGDVLLAGPPWQAWRAPSWPEIAAAEADEAAPAIRPGR